MKLATNFKDFPALTALFKDFQCLEFYFENQGLSRTFKDFQGACEPGREIKKAQHSVSDQVEAN